MAGVTRAIAERARTEPNVVFVLPAHRNSIVREALLPPLEGLSNVRIVEPLLYAEFARLIDCGLGSVRPVPASNPSARSAAERRPTKPRSNSRDGGSEGGRNAQ